MNGSRDRTRQTARPARPAHPPFTDFPLAAYVFVAAFDVISAVAGGRHRWAGQLWHAGTFVLVGGLGICLITMGTGFWDLVRFWPRSRAAVRTTALHICVMAAVFMIGVGDIAWRLSDYGSRASTPPGVAVLSLVTAIAACCGAFFGGKLVFSHGIGVAAQALAADKQLPDTRPANDHENGADELAAPASGRQRPPEPGPLA